MAGGGRWWAPLLVAAATLAVPLATLGWQVARMPGAQQVERPTPAPIIIVEQSGANPTPRVTAINVPPTGTPPRVEASRPRPTPTSTPLEVWRRESAFNFVALGVDRRQEHEIPRTDTIMIGNVDLNNHRLTLVSIPRDLVVEIPGYGQDRINAAYVYGEQFKEQDGGVGLVRRTIERNFGVPIHHYGVIDFACFRTAIDAIGGIEIDVPKAIVDPRYPTEDYGYKTVRFDPGRQRLNGERALEYARTRNADNDFQRIRRQQQVAAAFRREVLNLKTVPALPAIVAGCSGMKSDLGLMEFIGLARSLQRLSESGISMRVIDEQMAVDAYLGGAAVLLPRWEPIRALVRESFPTARVTALKPPDAN